ncbi:PilZ domain-containing protein [Luteimonas cucumeris]|uniref:PilZ domain-containing protein n=2 Tax=Luteimonas cucumeris TaxID=985012 RepID=A0A562LEZ5_9GAMM|nr:PilZ domain-containing protein [Luteimonas cucumeris]
MTSPEFRRARRRRAIERIDVIDTMTGAVIGQLGNLSESGLLLTTSTPPREDALYQWRFNLPQPGGGAATIECGAQVLWLDRASASGQFWAGARFILLPKPAQEAVNAWIEAPGGEYE